MAEIGREHLHNRSRAPFGDEDIPIVFAGIGGQDLFHRRLGANRSTAFIYDDRMLLHKNDQIPECLDSPERLSAVYDRCESAGLLARCLLMSPEPATDELIACCHSGQHVRLISSTEEMTDEECAQAAAPLDSVYFNMRTNSAARLAVGSVVRGVEAVHRGDVRNAFCLVRPPGHLAMESEACGFCIFNNVAIAVEYAVSQLNYDRVLILDWGVHHGHATQYQFYNSYRVLCISVHRYDDQTFWPGLRESNYEFTGTGRGRGYNINIPLNGGDVKDADYLAIFHHLILPVAFEFDPGLIVVSAGYDCAQGCPLGQMSLSPSVFAHFTHKLMCLAEGKLVVALEGGYYLDSLAESAAHTLSALLGDPLPSLDCLGAVKPSIRKTISNCVSVLRQHWRSLTVLHSEPSNHSSDLSQIPLENWSNVNSTSMVPPNLQRNPEKEMVIARRMEDLKQRHPVAFHSHFTGTCIVYDSRMENHKDEENHSHPETPNRIRRAYELLDEYGLARRCKRIEARFATHEELLRVHTEAHVDKIARTAGLPQTILNSMADEEDSIFFNRHSYDCALLAAGSLLAVVDEVCSGESLRGMALIRPPGHHATADTCMGFCLFNNVAIAARHAQSVYGLTRIAIIDWDVHHGNGTQEVFAKDPNVLYISVHRHDDGRFYPNSDKASCAEVGQEEGIGRTVQVAWNGKHARDAEYIASFIHIFLPVLYEFRAQLTIVSAGFDAARGDPLGCLGVSPECFGHLTHLLATVAHLVPHDEQLHLASDLPGTSSHRPVGTSNGAGARPHDVPKPPRPAGGLILALEGGYNLVSTAEAVCHSLASLLGDSCPRLAYGLSPSERGCKSIRRALAVQGKYWSQLSSCVTSRGHLEPRGGPSSDVNSENRVFAELALRLDDLNLSDTGSPHVQSQLITPVVNHPVAPPGVRPMTGGSAALAVDGSVPADAPTARALSDLSTMVNQPVTGESDSRSSASLEAAPPTHSSRPVASPVAAGASASSDLRPTVTDSTATLQNLISTPVEDMHAFLGLQLDQQLPERLFAVTPLAWCPHLTNIGSQPDWRPDVNQPCSRCSNSVENWVCLTCYTVCCGRFANRHMLEHFNSVGHSIVLSFADLSTWCYVCEHYVHNEALSVAKRAAHLAKFGFDPPDA